MEYIKKHLPLIITVLVIFALAWSSYASYNQESALIIQNKLNAKLADDQKKQKAIQDAIDASNQTISAGDLSKKIIDALKNNQITFTI